jgi:hypothetical protein
MMSTRQVALGTPPLKGLSLLPLLLLLCGTWPRTAVLLLLPGVSRLCRTCSRRPCCSCDFCTAAHKDHSCVGLHTACIAAQGLPDSLSRDCPVGLHELL